MLTKEVTNMERRKTRKPLCGVRVDLEVISIVMVRCARVYTATHIQT